MPEIDLHLGDCLDVLRTLPAGSVGLVLADPPFGTTVASWDAVIPFEPLWRELLRVTKPGGAFVFHANQPFTSALVMSQPRLFRYSWAWVKNKKTGQLSAKRRPMNGHEDIAVFGRKMPLYNRQMTPRVKPISAKTPASRSALYAGTQGTAQRDEYVRRTDSICPDTVLYFPVERGFHSTQKPLTLCSYLIATYSNPGDLVLDFCMGSASSGVSAVRDGRRYIGVEKNEDTFAIAAWRMAEARVGRFHARPPKGWKRASFLKGLHDVAAD